MLTFNALYPDALKPKTIKRDLGREYEGEFEENRKQRSIDLATGLPGRSETHAWIERDHRTVEEGTRAQLLLLATRSALRESSRA